MYHHNMSGKELERCMGISVVTVLVLYIYLLSISNMTINSQQIGTVSPSYFYYSCQGIIG